MMDSYSFQADLSDLRQQVEDYLNGCFVPKGVSCLEAPMRYSFFGGGKRLRPVIMLASARKLGMDKKDVLPFGLVLECIHIHSLIHDDLPSMDNAETRRGKPCCHVVYGEAAGLLAGDALLNYAYEIGLDACNTDEKISALRFMAKKAGISGMIGGQGLDTCVVSTNPDYDKEEVYRKKTSALFEAALCVPAIIGGVKQSSIDLLQTLGENLGILFQLTDDMIDFDAERFARPTECASRDEVLFYREKCLETVKSLGGWDFMEGLIEYICNRKS